MKKKKKTGKKTHAAKTCRKKIEHKVHGQGEASK